MLKRQFDNLNEYKVRIEAELMKTKEELENYKKENTTQQYQVHAQPKNLPVSDVQINEEPLETENLRLKSELESIKIKMHEANVRHNEERDKIIMEVQDMSYAKGTLQLQIKRLNDQLAQQRASSEKFGSEIASKNVNEENSIAIDALMGETIANHEDVVTIQDMKASGTLRSRQYNTLPKSSTINQQQHPM